MVDEVVIPRFRAGSPTSARSGAVGAGRAHPQRLASNDAGGPLPRDRHRRADHQVDLPNRRREVQSLAWRSCAQQVAEVEAEIARLTAERDRLQQRRDAANAACM